MHQTSLTMESDESRQSQPGTPSSAGHDLHSQPAYEIVEAPIAAKRMFCLRALFQRCEIEAELLANTHKTAPDMKSEPGSLKTAARNLNGWLKDERLWLALSHDERNWMEARPGDWPFLRVQQVGWRAEACGVIAWALNLGEQIPPYDCQYDVRFSRPDDGMSHEDLGIYCVGKITASKRNSECPRNR